LDYNGFSSKIQEPVTNEIGALDNSINIWYHQIMNSKNKKTMELILSMMENKGYLGEVEYDAQAKIFHGDVINTRDVITFQGTTVKEIEKAFKDSVDDYIDWCKEEGAEPEKPLYM